MSRCESWTIKKAEHEELMFLNCDVEDCWDSHGLQGDQTSQSYRKSTLNIHWKDWCRSSNTLATWCKEPTLLEKTLIWERLKDGKKGDKREWDGWMASLIQWTWVCTNSRRQWRTGKPDVLKSMRSQRVRHDWATKRQQISLGMWVKRELLKRKLFESLIGHLKVSECRSKRLEVFSFRSVT